MQAAGALLCCFMLFYTTFPLFYAVLYAKNDEFAVGLNAGNTYLTVVAICIKNDEFCIANDEFFMHSKC